MSNVIKAAQAWLAGKLKSHVSETATYRRGNNEFEIQVTVGQVADGLGLPMGGAQLRRVDKDFLVTAADLELGPARSGDLIDLDEQGATNRYMVVQPDEDTPVSEPVDPFGYMVRIHVKFVKAING